MKKLAILVFVSGTAVLSLAYAQKSLGKKASEGFVITYITRRTTHDANNGRNELAVRMVGTNGRWKETRWRDTGKTETVSDGTHVYSHTEKKATLDYEGTYYVGAEGRDEPLREIPDHVSSTGVMLGVKVYSTRNEQSDGSYIESTYSLETGTQVLKMVIYFGPSGETFTTEAVSLQFRPIKEEELTLPDFPVSFTKAERELEEMRNSGNEVDYLEEGIKTAKAEVAKKQR